jgi:hypothetical protein
MGAGPWAPRNAMKAFFFQNECVQRWVLLVPQLGEKRLSGNIDFCNVEEWKIGQ